MKLFDKGYGWYKGNLHTHTTKSDGEKTPEECIEIFKSGGYDFISITDHWHLSDSYSLDDMVVIRGCEYDFVYSNKRKTCHIVAVGVDSILNSDKGFGPQDAIDDIRRQGGISIIAHPHWSCMANQDLLDLKDYDGIEIYNALCAAVKNNGNSSAYINALSVLKKTPLLFATEDTHHYNRELFGGYIMVNSPELSSGALLDSIRKGRFYASEGPEIKQVEYNKETVRIETSPVKRIIFHPDSFYAGSCIFAPEEGYINGATHNIKPVNRAIRIECIDENGKRAWSQFVQV